MPSLPALDTFLEVLGVCSPLLRIVSHPSHDRVPIDHAARTAHCFHAHYPQSPITPIVTQVHLQSSAVCQTVADHLASVCIEGCTLSVEQRRLLRQAFWMAEAEWWMEEGVDIPTVSVRMRGALGLGK